MVIYELKDGSGLGNQMWGYAVCRLIAKHKNCPFSIIGKEHWKGQGFLEIDFSQNITGIIKHSVADNNIIMYDYNGIICSGNCIVYENNLWIRVYQSIHSKILPISQFPKIVYHANTNSGVYLHGGFTFRDFMETTNPAIYDWIHEIDLKLLNSQ